MVHRLVATPGCNVSLVDSQGNTPLHYAASLQEPQCLDALLTQPINGARSAVTQALNAFNYQGEVESSLEHKALASMFLCITSATFALPSLVNGDSLSTFMSNLL